jgi:hypothetical protein
LGSSGDKQRNIGCDVLFVSWRTPQIHEHPFSYSTPGLQLAQKGSDLNVVFIAFK